MSDDCSRADYATCSEDHISSNHRIGSDPDIIADGDRAGGMGLETWGELTQNSMVSCPQYDIWTYQHAITDSDVSVR